MGVGFFLMENILAIGSFSAPSASMTRIPRGSRFHFAIDTFGLYPSVAYVSLGKGLNLDSLSPPPVPKPNNRSILDKYGFTLLK
jgi:hypothetical protein